MIASAKKAGRESGRLKKRALVPGKLRGRGERGAAAPSKASPKAVDRPTTESP